MLGDRGRGVTLSVEQGDITEFPADVIALKYAQGFYGADAAMAAILKQAGKLAEPFAPRIGEAVIIPAEDITRAANVLYLGVPSLIEFGYGEIRVFAAAVIEAVTRELPFANTIAMTIHGVNYGLDEREALAAQIAGVADGVQRNPGPVLSVTIVEMDRSRAQRLADALAEMLPESELTEDAAAERRVTPGRPVHETVDAERVQHNLRDVGDASNDKPHVFVAMPFDHGMEDVYHYAIHAAVTRAGYLCERADMTHFTGDIVDRICRRIDTSSLVVADLTGANPNVFLEVGYAWGRDRPTVLVAREGEELLFDVRGHRVLHYDTIRDLENMLTAELEGLDPP